MKRFSLFVLVSVICAVMASAQTANPIRWRMSVKMDNATEGTITLRAAISDGWHLYGLALPENGPKPTKVDFSKSTGIKLTGSLTPARKPIVKHDDMFGMKLSFWADDITFTQKFKVTDAAKANVEATISFMGCNDENCMPPKSVTLKSAVASAAKAKGKCSGQCGNCSHKSCAAQSKSCKSSSCK